MELYRDSELGNGDPVILYDPSRGETQMIGTGWSSWDQLHRELEHVSETGHPTGRITPHAAEWIRGRDRLQVFGVEGEYCL